MSDVWELWSGSFSLVSGVDSDGDGVSNLRESIAGTDPFDIDDYLAGALNLAAAELILAWPAAAYKEYEVWGSQDLGAWLKLSGPTPIRYTQPMDAQFAMTPALDGEAYRLAVGDADADGDGVSDWSESVLGTTIEDPRPLDIPLKNDR